MSSNAAGVCAAVAATVLLTGAVVTAAVLCPESFKQERKVVVTTSPVVRVAPKHVAPPPGVPAYKVPMGQPYVIHSHCPGGIRIPTGYKYVVYNGTRYQIYGTPGHYYYSYNGINYPVFYL